MMDRNQVCELVALSAPDPEAARQACLRLHGRLAQEAMAPARGQSVPLGDLCRAEAHIRDLVHGGNFEDAETAALDLWDEVAAVFRDIQKREAAPRPGSMAQEFEQLGVIPGTLEVHPTVCQSMEGAAYLIESAKEYEEAEDYLIQALKEADNLLEWVQRSERVLSRAGAPWSG